MKFYFTYVLLSKKDNKFYTGYTNDIELFNRVNQEALAIEFEQQNIPFEKEKIIRVIRVIRG